VLPPLLEASSALVTSPPTPASIEGEPTAIGRYTDGGRARAGGTRDAAISAAAPLAGPIAGDATALPLPPPPPPLPPLLELRLALSPPAPEVAGMSGGGVDAIGVTIEAERADDGPDASEAAEDGVAASSAGSVATGAG
jgi:hypothetical protein